MGLAAGTAGTLLNFGQTRALGADFDWQAHKGKTIKLLLNKHPYADAMIANLENFKQLTGMDVVYDVFPGRRLFRQGDGGAVVGLARNTTPS